jgi:hypothetical protein
VGRVTASRAFQLSWKGRSVLRLSILNRGRTSVQRVLFPVLGWAPFPHTDIFRVFCYRSDLFGRTFSALTHELLCGPSYWTRVERERMGSFVAELSHCDY